MTPAEILKVLRKEQVTFLRLQFSDILGAIKTVEVPSSKWEKALDGQTLFDGSSIEGFIREKEQDMLLKPDYDTFQMLSSKGEESRAARIVCDVHNADGTPFEGCPRLALKRVLQEAERQGFRMMVGFEVEFFLFQRRPDGEPTTRTEDAAGYFDLSPIDRGEAARRDLVLALEQAGVEVEAAHHEVAHGQHEVDFRHTEARRAADNLCTFRFLARNTALKLGLHVTFMPKPIWGQEGSGLHIHQSLSRDGKNAFYDPSGSNELSPVALGYIGGLLRHARGMALVTNPLINSYKRLVQGYEAPTHAVWSEHNVNPLVRIPARRGPSTRAELRMPDPSCNPYLALACILKAGLEGIRKKMDPGPPISKNLFRMSHREQRRFKIDELPGDLREAITFLKKDDCIQEALGKHIYQHLVEAKHREWRQYIQQVHPWELDHYLRNY